MAFNTGNPIGSTDPRDFSDNSENLDRAVNNTASATWTDRFGNSRTSLAGQIGYIGTGANGAIEDYAAGQELTTFSTIIRYSGEFYRPASGATLPYTTTATTPDVDANLVSVGDATLRQDLADNTTGGGSDLVAHTGTSDTVTQALNKRIIYVGSVADIETASAIDGQEYSVKGTLYYYDQSSDSLKKELLTSARQYGLSDSGDNLGLVTDLSASPAYALMPPGQYTFPEYIITQERLGLSGDKSVVVDMPTADASTLNFLDNGEFLSKDIEVNGLSLNNSGTHTTNDYSVIGANGLENFRVTFNNLSSPTSGGFSLGYGTQALAENVGSPSEPITWVEQLGRIARKGFVLGNNASHSIIGFELFGSVDGKLIGNSSESSSATERASSHGYRITGYPGTPTTHNAYSGNTARQSLTGYSLQTAVKYNSINGALVDDTEIGIQVRNTVYPDYRTGFNYIQAIATNSDKDGAQLNNLEFTRLDFISDVAGEIGLNLVPSADEGINKFNLVDSILSKSELVGARIGCSNSVIRIVASEFAGNGVTISGDYNIVDIIIDDAGFRNVDLSGNRNTVRIVSTNHRGAGASVEVRGSNNSVDVECERLDVSGAGNVIRGHVGNIISADDGNDYSGIYGLRQSRQETITTNASGEFSIDFFGLPDGAIPVTQFSADQFSFSGAPIVFRLKSRSVASGTATATFVAYDMTGAPLASTGITVMSEMRPLSFV